MGVRVHPRRLVRLTEVTDALLELTASALPSRPSKVEYAESILKGTVVPDGLSSGSGYTAG